MTAAAVRGGKIEPAQVAADAFGNALAGSITSQLEVNKQAARLEAEYKRQRDALAEQVRKLQLTAPTLGQSAGSYRTLANAGPEDPGADLPAQKGMPGSVADGDLAPLLIAANDDRLAASLLQEAKENHQNRGVDETPDARSAGTAAAFFAVDEPTAPNIRHDHGFLDDGHGNLDETKRREATVDDYKEKAKWQVKLELAKTLRQDLADATDAYDHFLHGGGKDREFSYERYVAGDKAGRDSLDSIIEDAMAGAVQLHGATGRDGFRMQTGEIMVGGDNGRYPYPGTENWQKAIGGHALWADAPVRVDADETGRRFSIDLTVHAEDRYNFNPGAQNIATGTPDAANGRFEVTGLGHEFMSRATLSRRVEFTAPLVTTESSGQLNLEVTRPR